MIIAEECKDVACNPLLEAARLREVEIIKEVINGVFPLAGISLSGLDRLVRQLDEVILKSGIETGGTNRNGVDERKDLAVLLGRLLVPTQLRG